MSSEDSAGSDTATQQTSLITPEARIRQALSRATRRDYDRVFGLSSGGQDSLFAIEATRRFGPEYGIEIDAVVHFDTGAGVEASRETLKQYASERDLAYFEIPNAKKEERVGPQTLKYGFPGPGGGRPFQDRKHSTARILRKDRPEQQLYQGFGGELCFISGAHVEESEQRKANMGSAAVDFGETGDERPRRTWLCPVYGLLPEEIDDLIDEWGIPRSESYDTLGYSGDCTGCSYDDWRKFHWLWTLQPSLAWAWSALMVWMNQLRGADAYPLDDDLDDEWQLPPERTIWGWGALSDDAIATIRQEDPHWPGGVDDLDIETAEDAEDSELSEYLGCESCAKQCAPAIVSDGGKNNRPDDECPECGSTNSTYENPVLEEEFQCSTCVIAFTADGEVTARD